MQELYQINVIPSHKPWRGFQSIYTTSEEVFNYLSERWLPDLDITEVPEKYRHLLVEMVWNEETEESEPYTPNGTEDWENGSAIVDGEEVYLEMSGANFVYNIESEVAQLPFILLGTTEAYTE